MGRFLACFARFSFSDGLVFRALAILLSSASLFWPAGVPAQSCLVSSIKAGSTHLGSLCCWATSVEAGGQNLLGWVFSSHWVEGRGGQASGTLALQEGQPDCWCPCEVRTEISWSVTKSSRSNRCHDRVRLLLPQPFVNTKKALGQQRPLVLKVWSVNSGVGINQDLVGNAEHCIKHIV